MVWHHCNDKNLIVMEIKTQTDLALSYAMSAGSEMQTQKTLILSFQLPQHTPPQVLRVVQGPAYG